MSKKEIIEKLCLLYQSFLEESHVYDGANFWGKKEVKSLLVKLEIKSKGGGE